MLLNNLDYAFDTLTEEMIDQAFTLPHDYILFELVVFNAAGFATIEATKYSPSLEEETNSNGNLFLPKSDFLQLFNESKSQNPYLINL